MSYQENSDTIHAGFDLTDMNASAWKEMLETFGMNTEAKDDDSGWKWECENGYIITANDPITGNYHDGGRENEVDYCSYIGISGTPDFVARVYIYIQNHAIEIKGSYFGARIYI